jgi:hypothetical protein
MAEKHICTAAFHASPDGFGGHETVWGHKLHINRTDHSSQGRT